MNENSKTAFTQVEKNKLIEENSEINKQNNRAKEEKGEGLTSRSGRSCSTEVGGSTILLPASKSCSSTSLSEDAMFARFVGKAPRSLETRKGSVQLKSMEVKEPTESNGNGAKSHRKARET